MTADGLHPRFAASPLREALADSPVVLVHGPRQSGKTTLARMVCEPLGYGYVTFDDDVMRRAAAADPVGFVGDFTGPMVIDEVQRVPGLFTALKHAVDRHRVPGRFVLAGSANVLLLPRIADSLAGRMEIVRLHPLSQAEREGGSARFLERLLGSGFALSKWPRLGRELAERVAGGGYPAALVRPPGVRRRRWYRDYLQAIVDRDVRDLSRLQDLSVLPRLLSLAASQTARLINVTEISAPFQVTRPTIRSHVSLLERVFLLEELPAWHSNKLSRLVKTPKLHLCDTGLAAALLGMDDADLWEDRGVFGQLLETFVLQELRREASGVPESFTFHHFRDRDGTEVDIVIEQGPCAIAGVEVKAAASVSEADFRGLRKLRDAAGKAFRNGAVIYDGETCVGFGDRLFAVPARMLWQSE
jgi:predicted AAA+ superfamily ATPase